MENHAEVGQNPIIEEVTPFFDRFRRQLTLTLGVVAASSVLALSMNSATAEASSLPPQFVYDSCNFALTPTECDQRIDSIASEGLNGVLESAGPDGSKAEIEAADNTAEKDGMKIIWSLEASGWWQNYTPNGTTMLGVSGLCPSCTTNSQLLKVIINTTKGKSNYGYYIADDSQIPQSNPGPSIAGLKDFTNYIHTYDSSAKTIVSDYKIDASGHTLSQYKGAADVVVQETYPVHSDNSESVDNTQANLSKLAGAVTPAAEAVNNSKNQGEEAGAVLQAWAWSDSKYDDPSQFADQGSTFPTAKQLVTMRNTMVNKGHPNVILYFNYDQVDGYPTGQSLPYWRNVSGNTRQYRMKVLKDAVTAPL
jgi:hypothetical protein